MKTILNMSLLTLLIINTQQISYAGGCSSKPEAKKSKQVAQPQAYQSSIYEDAQAELAYIISAERYEQHATKKAEQAAKRAQRPLSPHEQVMLQIRTEAKQARQAELHNTFSK